jgi:hypothetical protein
MNSMWMGRRRPNAGSAKSPIGDSKSFLDILQRLVFLTWNLAIGVTVWPAKQDRTHGTSVRAGLDFAMGRSAGLIPVSPSENEIRLAWEHYDHYLDEIRFGGDCDGDVLTEPVEMPLWPRPGRSA